MPRPPRTIQADEVERLAGIRAAATKVRAATIQQGPDPAADILGAIAWAWAALGEDATELTTLVEVALTRHRMSWREIAAACGVGVDPVSTPAEIQLAVEAFAAARRRRRA